VHKLSPTRWVVSQNLANLCAVQFRSGIHGRTAGSAVSCLWSNVDQDSSAAVFFFGGGSSSVQKQQQCVCGGGGGACACVQQ
jgi:hypothetical protein